MENARLYTLPNEPPPILVAAGSREAARLAGRAGDGLIGTSPDEAVVRCFDEAGGEGKPRYGQITVCWAEDEERARRTAYERWPNAAITGELGQELPLPRHFEQTAQMLSEEDACQGMPCGPDPETYLKAVRSYADAGFDHVYFHQVGPDQEGFFRFFDKELRPKI